MKFYFLPAREDGTVLLLYYKVQSVTAVKGTSRY